MNKVLIVGIAALMLGGANIASAAQMTMTPSQHPVYGDPAKGMEHTVIGYISNIDWDKAQAEKASRDSNDLPVIGGGVNIVDEAGVVYKNACSQEGVARHQCVVLVNTPEYRANMLLIARSIVVSGVQNAFPQFAGWFKLVK